jgi:hypothetical protein
MLKIDHFQTFCKKSKLNVSQKSINLSLNPNKFQKMNAPYLSSRWSVHLNLDKYFLIKNVLC